MNESENNRPAPRQNQKRRVIVVLALVGIAFALAIWMLRPIKSAVAVAANSESMFQHTAPKPPEEDALNKQAEDNEKTAPDSPPSRAAATPVEDKSSLATMSKDIEDQTPEVCGLSVAEAKEFLANLATQSIATTNRVLAEASSKLTQSNNVREKAAGLYLFALVAGGDAAESERLNYPGCKGNDDCVVKPYQATQNAAPTNAEPLIKFALESNDVGAYAAALYACRGADTGACATISYAQWAEMEPDNAAAWMMAAGEAENRKDSAARAALLQRAVGASSYNTRLPNLAEVVALDEIRTQPPLTLTPTMNMIIGINAAAVIPSMMGISRHCARPETMDDARRATCDALLTKMAEQDETLSGLMMAKSIGKSIGWSAERLQPLNDEFEVYTGHIFAGTTEKNVFGCAALAKGKQLILRSFAVGERGAIQEIVEKSGKSLAELAADYRKSSATDTK